MATQEEHAQQIRDLTAQNEKARTEQLKRFTALEEALKNAGKTTPEVDEALSGLKASIQADDDLNPDEQSAKKKK